MPGELPRRATYRWLSISLGVAASIYGWYAINQYQQLNDLNQRQLSSAGAEIKTALDNAAETVRQFNDKWMRSPRRPDIMGPWRDNDYLRVCDFVRSQPYLRLQKCIGGRPEAVEWNEFTTVQWTTDANLQIEVSGPQNEIERFRYRTDRLLRELAFPDGFALIFLADDKGNVLFQDAPSRRRWHRFLRWGEQTFRDAYADRQPALQIHNLQQLVGGEDSWRALSSVTSRTTVELAGTDHLLYVQPLVVNSQSPVTIIVGGAVPRSALVRDALALGGPFLGVLVFLILACAFGFPFVKLACLDRHERFRLRDVKLLYLSSGALLVLLTCVTLALDGYTRWRREADRGLERLAEHLEQQFLNELEAIQRWITEYDATVERKINEEPEPCDDWPVDTLWYASNAPRLPWAHDAHFKTVSWIEPGGQQVWKTTADAVPGRLRVGQRVYFRAVRQNSLFRIRGNGAPLFFTPDRSIADAKFYTFVSMPSQVTSSRCGGAEHGPVAQADEPLVVAATAQLLSLDRQPLPAGYGFALINREGRVLYHSDERLSLRENLFDELSDGDSARAMTYALDRGGIDTRYRERLHRVHLHPIDITLASDAGEAAPEAGAPGSSAGFYLAVFRDRTVEQALVGHVFVVGLIAPMTLVLLLCAGGLVILAAAGRRCGHCWSAWLWPHEGLNHIYRRQALTLMALLAFSVVMAAVYGSAVPLLLVSPLALAAACGIYCAFASRAGERRKLAVNRWQTLSVMLTLVSLVVVPTIAFFHVTLNRELAKLIVTEREWMREQEADWRRAAEAGAVQEQYVPERTRELLTARAHYLDCVPAPFEPPAPSFAPALPSSREPGVMRTSMEAPAASLRLTPVRCGADGAGEPSRRAGLQPQGVAAQLVSSLEFEQLLPVENELMARRVFQQTGLSYSPEGTLVPWLPASGIALLGLALIIVVLSWWVRWNTNHLFFADLEGSNEPPAGTFQEIWKRCSIDERLVLVQTAREHIANPYQRAVIAGLLAKGIVQLAPDVRPFSDEFEAFLHAKARDMEAQIREWEHVDTLHSWRSGRLVLACSVGAIAFFLLATQPGLQSSIMAVATGVTGVVTAVAKLQELLSSWLARKAAA
jgi:hypothetical protein